MYIPSPFRMSDNDEIINFIQAHGFGILVNAEDRQPFATHLPFLYDVKQNVLLTHMAKANPQWRNLDGETVMAIFSGPHAYISPSWYGVPASVPTWNYVAVHVYGTCSVINNDEDMGDLLQRIVQFYEPDSDVAAQGNEPYYRNLMKAIVGMRIQITEVQGAAKLSQNKPADVQQRVMTHLFQAEDKDARGIAQRMQTRLSDLKGGQGVADL